MGSSYMVRDRLSVRGVFLWGLVSFGLGQDDCGCVGVWLVFGQGWVGSQV